jgi:hypothetical protein
MEPRWSGAELRDLVTKELAPYRKGDGTRVSIEGPVLVLEPKGTNSSVICHELARREERRGGGEATQQK